MGRGRGRETAGYELSRETQTVVAGEGGACSLPEMGWAFDLGFVRGGAHPAVEKPVTRSITRGRPSLSLSLSLSLFR
jgi:hypothetical protein